MLNRIFDPLSMFPWWARIIIVGVAGYLLFGLLKTAGWYLVLAAILLWSVALLSYLYWLGELGPLERLPGLAPALAFVITSRRRSAPPPPAFPSSNRAQPPPTPASGRGVEIGPEEIAQALNAGVIGQSAACREIAIALTRQLAKKQRLGAAGKLLFVGPSRTGKTFAARRLAAILGRKLLFFDMAQYAAPSSFGLFGAPAGYGGAAGQLTGGLKQDPGAVIVLDDIEKADAAVHAALMTAFRDGYATEASTGERVAVVDAIFVLTTNVGNDAGGGTDQPAPATAVDILRDRGFPANLLNQISDIVAFARLAGLDIARVAALEIESKVHEYGCEIRRGGIDPKILIDIIKLHEDAGPLAVSRQIIHVMDTAIGLAIRAAHSGQGGQISISAGGPRGYSITFAPLDTPELRSLTDMDPLDRLTDKAALEAAINARTRSRYIDAAALAAALKSTVIGQDSVCDEVAVQIRRRVAAEDRSRPVGVFLFAGPPGTGKTYLAKQLAKELNRKLQHFDMTQFADRHAVTQLFGVPKGYVGQDSYGKLTAALRDVPSSVILLDEIEKADPDVLKRFLTAWNDGFTTEASDNATIKTTDAIFVLTTNAAVDRLSEYATTYAAKPDELRRASVNALKEARFAPEVLNRIDGIFVFRPLTGMDLAAVAALEIEAMIKNYGMELVGRGIDAQVLFELTQRMEGLGPAASTRDMTRAIEQGVIDSVIQIKERGVKKVRIVIVDGEIRAEAVG